MPSSPRRDKARPKRSSDKPGVAGVIQFKITLQGTKPPIWRRIQVPSTYSFWDWHVAIQNSCGEKLGHGVRIALATEGRNRPCLAGERRI